MLLDRIPVRLRLSLGHAIWMALLFSAIGVGLYRVVEHNMNQAVDAALMTSAKSIRDARSVRGFNAAMMESLIVSQFFGERFIRPYAQLIDLSGRVSSKTNTRISLPVTPNSAARAEHGLETFEIVPRRGQPAIRQITLPVMTHGIFSGELIQVGAPLDSVQTTLEGVLIVLWIALPAGLAMSIIFGYVLTARAFKPVRELTVAAGRLSVERMDRRLRLPPARDELRALARTYNEMLDRISDAFKRLRRFSGDVSHELRTPLAVLRGEAELALRRVRTPEEYQLALQNIVREAASMTEVVEELLLLARAESKNVVMHWQDVGLDDFLSGLRHSVLPIFTSRHVELRMHNLAGVNFRASAGYLALALKNILLNAAKHSPQGGSVDLSVWREGDDVVFAVRDQGEGISDQDMPYIFDPFYRADTVRNRAAGGAGIGLSLTMALVKLHNGILEAKSKPGEGATFTLRVPQKDRSDDVPASNSARAKKEAAFIAGASERGPRDDWNEVPSTDGGHRPQNSTLLPPAPTDQPAST